MAIHALAAVFSVGLVTAFALIAAPVVVCVPGQHWHCKSQPDSQTAMKSVHKPPCGDKDTKKCIATPVVWKTVYWNATEVNSTGLFKRAHIVTEETFFSDEE